tara:strand:- start:818 stop:1414 length:597 start_codon:yes stop_codon:yes gene_type:complete
VSYLKFKEILFFSSNFNKLKEVKSFFDNSRIKILSPLNFNIEIEPKEDGKTFSENAKKKSLFGYKKTNLPCFADDSGICIEALQWRPNIHSKRFIQKFKNKTECFEHIIQKVKKSQKNKAYFQTSICYTTKENYHIVFTGKIDGIISTNILGNKGFGYDPIFIPNGLKKTFGQLKLNEKNEFSHRSIAVRKFVNFLIN